MKRNKQHISRRDDDLHRHAYSFQQGEFYPEHHEANVQRLHEMYPEFSGSEINEIYRQACRIDFEVKKLIGKSELTKEAKEQLLDLLKDQFYGFPDECFLKAVERAQLA